VESARKLRFDSPELLEVIYDAVLAPEEWDAILSSLAEGHHADFANLGLHDLQKGIEVIPWHFFGLGERERHLLLTRYLGSRNPYSVVFASPCGQVLQLEEIVPVHVVRRSQLYEEVIRSPRSDYGIGFNLETLPLFGCLAFFRGIDAGPFSKFEIGALQRLVPHILRATQTMARLCAAERRSRLVCDALDCLSTPLLLVDADAQIHYMNYTAETLMASRDGLRANGRKVEALLHSESLCLLKLIRDAACLRHSLGSSAGGCMAVTRSEDRNPLHVLVAPLAPNRATSNWPQGDLAIVLASRPEFFPSSTQEHLRARYGLTAAESSVAILSADGEGLSRVADRLGLSISTIRTHMQRVFAKTDTRRQAQLVQLISSLPTRLLRDTGKQD
jgi:DNA-binding CsgD family transcriptional regulator